MKQYIILFFSGWFICVASMEAPPGVIPLAVRDNYAREQKKFAGYHLDRPDYFVQRMQKDFKKAEDISSYVKLVHLFASNLLVQHLAIYQVNINSYLQTQWEKVREHYNLLLRKVNAHIDKDEMIHLVPENDYQLNNLLTHSHLINSHRVLLPEEQAVLFSWIVDPEKGTWLNNIGRLGKVDHEGVIIEQMISKNRDTLGNLIVPFSHSKMFDTVDLIAENADYLYEITMNVRVYVERSAKVTSIKERDTLAKRFFSNDFNTAQLYRLAQSWYQTLYKIVRKELYDSFVQAARVGKQNLREYLTPIPAQAVKDGALPAKFPETLEPILDPRTFVVVPTLDSELEAAREKWKKHQTAPAKIKKKKIRKRRFYPTVAQMQAEEPSIQAKEESIESPIVKKRQAPDGSYITEDAEDDLSIAIEDPVHGSTAIIFKTQPTAEERQKLNNLPPIHYTPWVNLWFQDPEKARIDQGYTKPGNPKYKAGEPSWHPIVVHAFAQLVDEYIKRYGRVSTTPSRKEKDKKDILVTIPGKMIFPNNEEVTGVFTYVIDSTSGQWYHRMFTPESGTQLVSDLVKQGYFAPTMQGYYDVYFPPLPGKQ